MNPSITSALNNAFAKPSWSGGSSFQQYFSFPNTMIYYITKNPLTAAAYNKLIQSCKCFFEKMPILVVANMYNSTTICSNANCYNSRGECCIKADLNKIQAKFWITYRIHQEVFDCPIFSSFLRYKIYRYVGDYLRLYQKNILFDDLIFLASSVKNVNLVEVKVTKSNGKIATLEELLEFVPNISYFTYIFENDIYKPISFKNITKSINYKENLHFKLINIPEIFNANELSTFILDHKESIFLFDFCDNLLSEKYKALLDAIIDGVIESEINCRIFYKGQNKEKRYIMEYRWMDTID